MKKTFYYLFAAIALLAAASCQKEIQPNDNNSSRGGEIITVVFDNSATKTTLDEGTPKWATGDVIWLSDGTNNSTVTVQAADNGKTSFSFEKPAEITGATLYAVYPSTAAVGIASEKIQFTIPSEQDGKFSTANICVAKSTSTTLTFKNATAILQFGTIASGIKHVVVPATNITGKYEVATPGDAPTVVTGQGNNTVTLSPSESVSAYYVAVAPVTISNKTDVRYEDVNWTIVGSNQTTSSKTLERSKIYNFGNPEANGTIPNGMLKYAFSVSATKKVYFSKSNLYWDGSAFNFETNQYDDLCSSTHISHFYWSKDPAIACAETYKDEEADVSDVLFTNATETTANSDFTVDGVTGIYRSLSIAEWQYLFNTRTMTNGKNRYSNHVTGGITIESKQYFGLFLYPDDYSGDVVSNSMTWAEINAAGIVFLRASGSRVGFDIDIPNTVGGVLSSSAFDKSQSYIVYFTDKNVYIDYKNNRSFAFSVRLITE